MGLLSPHYATRPVNFGALPRLPRDLTHHRRAEGSLPLEITNVLVSRLDIRRLLAAISASIRRVIAHDYAGPELYDEESGELRLQSLDDPYTGERGGYEQPAGLDQGS